MQMGVKTPKLDGTVGSVASSSTTSNVIMDDFVQIDEENERNVGMPPRRKSSFDHYETEETRKLGNKELQRLVLLHQLKTAKLQQEYYTKKIEAMEDNQFNSNQNFSNKQTIIVEEGDKSYAVLS
jgi:hypothetical protein